MCLAQKEEVQKCPQLSSAKENARFFEKKIDEATISHWNEISGAKIFD